jgi:nitrile hydratase accessory protein
LSRPEPPLPDAAALEHVVFEAPWQAQIFALTVKLSQAGYFTWSEWVQSFGRRITTSPVQNHESDTEAYYRQWIEALEDLVQGADLLKGADLVQRAAEWRLAYLNTPHGQPIDLHNAYRPPARQVDVGEPGRPLAVSPALCDPV